MFSDNDRITRNQLKRQVLLSLSGSFLLVQSEMPQFYGREGFLGILLCFPAVLLYLYFLVKVSPAYKNPVKMLGKAGAWLFLLPYYLFLVLSGSFFLRHTAQMIQKYLVPGMSLKWILLLVLASAFLGTGVEVQRRARIAQAAAPLVLGGFFVMTAIAAFSVNPAHLQQQGALEPVKIMNSAGCFFLACLLLSLQPFVLNQVEQGEKSFKTLAISMGLLTFLFLAILWILTGTFGYQGLLRQETPVLKLMSGVLLPGKFLERFDVIWMAVLLFSLLYLCGSLIFYGERIGSLLSVRGGAWLLMLLMYAGALWGTDGRNIGDYYGAVEPEKRAYPLCLAIDWKDEQYQVIYGIVNLAESTGQEKEQENAAKEERLPHAFSGKSFEEIEKVYEESQEYYLDLGHVQAVILGETLLKEDEKTRETLDYLEQEPLLGRTAGVFSCEDIQAVMKKSDSLPDSLGVYLNGIYKNRPDKKEPVSLEEVFYSLYNGTEFPHLPVILVEEEGIRLKKTE